MKIFKNLCLLLALASIFMACKKEDDDGFVTTSKCVGGNADFNALYLSLIESNHTDDVTADTEIHEYTFTLSEDKEVCEIGYQSQPEIESAPYTIEIIDSVNNTVLYSAQHLFSSKTTSFTQPSTALNLKAGTAYTLRRIQTDYGTITNTIGRLAFKNQMDFPYSLGIITITSSRFDQNGGPLLNWGIPYIDLRFK